MPYLMSDGVARQKLPTEKGASSVLGVLSVISGADLPYPRPAARDRGTGVRAEAGAGAWGYERGSAAGYTPRRLVRLWLIGTRVDRHSTLGSREWLAR